MKKNIFALTLLALTAVGITSCEDMLTGDMDRNVGIEEVASDTLYSYWGIYKSVLKVAERYVILGECRGDMVSGTEYVSDSISAILNFGKDNTAKDGSCRFLKAADFYHIINSCNAYIQNADITALTGLNRPRMLNEYAQIVTIRAWAYMQLVLAYGRVPYFEKPMLSTADMEEFRNATQYVDANTLASTHAVQMVDEVRHIPSIFAEDPTSVIAYPDYGIYGGYSASDPNIIAYASQCIFPQDVVLGDIYLLSAQGQGSEADYRKAAQYYYNFFNSEKGGTLSQFNSYCRLRKDRTTDQFHQGADVWTYMFRSISQANSNNEVVTVIPSSKSKLNGVVFSAMNELFGFDQIRSVKGDSTGTGTITFDINFQHQLDASTAYKTLNKNQDFEIYVGNSDGESKCLVNKGAGDARYRMTTYDITDTKTGSMNPINFVMKQNANFAFSTTYPVIYRKGSIWLHFAEALNGAGFPGYAFAILRHGLIGADKWVPKDADSYDYVSFIYFDPTDQDETGAPIVVVNPNDPDVTFKFYDPTTATEETTPQIYDDYKQFFDERLHAGLEPLKGKKHEDSIKYVNQHMVAETDKKEYQAKTGIVCKYISQEETEAAAKAENSLFLNFNTQFLRGETKTNNFTFYWGVDEYQDNSKSGTSSHAGGVSVGIHARGCGFLKLEEKETQYNYVNQINRMRQRYAGSTDEWTEKQVYNPANKREVQEAIAALILEELGLETAFEGNRFFDLLCYSRMIGGQKGVERVAKMISERGGSSDGALYSYLLNSANWYFKLPQ